LLCTGLRGAKVTVRVEDASTAERSVSGPKLELDAQRTLRGKKPNYRGKQASAPISLFLLMLLDPQPSSH
jgi:hypothetical protein